LRCPLCDSADIGASGYGSILFDGRRYEYRECRRCGSSACDPMPDAEALARMYGPAYATAGAGAPNIGDPKEPAAVLACLGQREPGLFVDFGCGSGSLLIAARALRWTAVGVEFQADVVEMVAKQTGCLVLNGLDALRGSQAVPADVIHLGDVIEHLTTPLDVVLELARLLRPTGCLLAQGPLEAGPCLFSTALRATRRFRCKRPTEMPPYHVVQASVLGQRLLFERAGLSAVEYRVSEVAWPAPAGISADVVMRPRALGLFVLRKASQAISALSPDRLGNRYFYVGVPR
jgi:SAM-dependent methyltransferase